MTSQRTRSGLGRRAALAVALVAVAAIFLPSQTTGQTAAAPAPTAPPSAGGPSPFAPLSAFSQRKAQTLLRDKLPCLGCHTLEGSGGKIGPDLSSVRERRSQDYIARMIRSPQRTSPGSAMPRTAMAPRVEALVVRYLANLPGAAPLEPSSTAQTPVAAAPTPANGPALYARWCSACHGDGKGNGANAQNLPVRPSDHTDRARLATRPDDSLYDTISAGGAVMNLSNRMPAFGETLSPAEIRALVAHIQSLCRCLGPSWSRDGAKP